jgi:hypothetical protein
MKNSHLSQRLSPRLDEILSHPNLRQLISRFDCELKDIKVDGISQPFETVYKYRQLVEQEKNRKEHLLVSFFKGGIIDVVPYRDITISQLYQLITGQYLEKKTKKLKELYALTDGEVANTEFSNQKRQLPYATFSGTFSKRKDDCLIRHSNLYCLDCDNVSDPEALKQDILRIEDLYFETVLMFASPSGQGLKWIIYLEPNNFSHKENFVGIQNYILQTYGIPSDNTPEVSRACFVCHDPLCFVNPKFVQR